MNWLITRHQGLIDWAQQKGQEFDVVRDHLDPADFLYLGEGDRVYGILPLYLINEVGQHGAVYWHLEIKLTLGQRGTEFTEQFLHQQAARWVCYDVWRRLADQNV